MKKKTSLLRGMAFAAVLALGAGLAVSGAAQAAEKAADKSSGIDLIMLDGKVPSGKAQLPPVAYFHSLHDTVNDCAACHTPPAGEGGTWNWDFKNSADFSGDIKDFYHTACVSCHESNAALSMKAGPGIAECRSCHAEPGAPVLGKAGRATVDFSMGSELHDMHMESANIPVNEGDLNCGACHHVYDAEARKLVPDYDPAESCRSCHGETASENPANPGSMILSFKDASHASCVSCHLDMGMSTSCDSCHSVAGQ